MNSNDLFNLTFSRFRKFKPLVFAKTKKKKSDHELKFVLVAIPVPNSSFCIVGSPKIERDDAKKKVRLNVVIKGHAPDDVKFAGSMLYFSYDEGLSLPKKDSEEYELIVTVELEGDDRPPKVGKSVLKTVDEEE